MVKVEAGRVHYACRPVECGDWDYVITVQWAESMPEGVQAVSNISKMAMDRYAHILENLQDIVDVDAPGWRDGYPRLRMYCNGNLFLETFPERVVA